MSYNSILDNDFYKFTMQYAVVKLYPDTKAKYEFINRGKHEFPKGYDKALKKRIKEMSKLSLTNAEKKYLHDSCPYLNMAYLDFLQGYRYDPSEVEIVQQGTDLKVSIEGYWYRTILWEVPLLSLISEVFYEMTDQQRDSDKKAVETLKKKFSVYRDMGVKVAEFGTRRRHSYQVQKLIDEALKKFG